MTDFIELTSRHKSYVRPDDRKFEIRIKSPGSNQTEAEMEKDGGDDDDDGSETTIEFDETSDFAFDEKLYLGRII